MDSWTQFLLLNRKPIQLNTLSACVLVAGTQKYFPASLYSLGNCGLRGLHQSKANNYKLLILVLSFDDLLSSSSGSSFSSILSSGSSESNSLLLGLEGRSCAEEVDGSLLSLLLHCCSHSSPSITVQEQLPRDESCRRRVNLCL